jgi:uncharacterized protein (DUF2252 family)
MARSPHRFVRGNTAQFYEWLASPAAPGVPDGPAVWIGGDCHVGNLGPVADATGRIRVLVRDVDQTVVGNPAHDLIRLALSLASAARGSNLPGVTTARILEAMTDGYLAAFDPDVDDDDGPAAPDAVRVALKEAHRRTWKHLAKERLRDTRPDVPLGRKFWPVADEERSALAQVFATPEVARLATLLESRDDDAEVEFEDAAYWMKGCSSLGLLRFGVLLGVRERGAKSTEYCLMDVKEAVASVAPAAPGAAMPGDYAERVVEGARHLTPFLGERMRATTLLGRPVFIRELLPQDLKLDIERLSEEEALKAAGYLAGVVGAAHARQMDAATRAAWRRDLERQRSRDLDAPSWLWSNVVGLLVDHERTYLEHCRRYALADERE